ncbi:DUF3826 domain-containing protein [Pelagicoccus sp. SDUM812005]|uniref:DUF3826 domain-containing protein n=1 Tax=Pelagicoccus sp. SDUM812005 TaxID=3041257 RepID=UPI00280E0E84|nr:DUF3826 domain-containing protein [Pelagicoccus sp. SDUM812005]MDQ8179142.1 DUF3826 domain-containing protein [Pelagicoccus sp. SDUM812005]
MLPFSLAPYLSRKNALASASLSLIAAISIATTPSHAATPATVAAASQAQIDQKNYPQWWTASLPAEIKKNVEEKGNKLASKLDLASPSQTQAVARLIAQHYGRVWAWHQEVDPELDATWDDWDLARSNLDGKEKDELKALAIMSERIDPIYAQFTPQIQGFLAELRAEIGEEKTIQLLDTLTRSPGAPRTYNAYLAMVPQMTEDEKAIIWNRLAQAREDSLACWSSKRIIKIFKKYKIRNEFSIDYFGYGYRKHYQAWIEASKK